MANDKRIPELTPLPNPTPDVQLAAYDLATDTTYRVSLSQINPGATDLPDQWDPGIDYAAGNIVSYSQGPGQPFQIWVSSVGSNQGNVPGPASAFWETPVDTPSVGFPAPWAAGIYTAAYAAVVHNGTIYWLNPAAGRPYNSTDIDAEIIAGDWINLGATTSGTVTSVSSGNLSPLFTVAVGTPTTTPALSFTLSNAAQNAFLAGPVSGGPGAPAYRAILVADLPDLSTTYQPLDADLSAIAALGFTSTSFLKKTAANTWTLDTITYLPLSGGTLTGALTLNADPASALQAATKQYVDALVVGLWDDRGSFDASVNAYPSSGGSGTAGAILKGDIWTVSFGGTLPTGQIVEPGDTVRSLINTPGNTQANWAIAQNNIGYTPLSNTLNSANIFVGSAGNVAVGVTMSGEASISNIGAITLSNAAVIAKVLTAYAAGAGAVSAADTILSAIQKVDGNSSNASVIARVLTGFTSGAGTVSAADTILSAFQKVDGNTSNASVIAKVLTGFVSGAGAVTAADSILSAIQKVDGNSSNATVISRVLTGFVSGAGTVTAADSILSAIQKVDGNSLDRWKLTGTSTLTGNVTIGGAFSVGFGVAPSAKIHIQGLAATTGEVLRITNSTPTTVLTILENGKVTFTGSQSGAAIVGYQWNNTWTATANSQTNTQFDFFSTATVGAFTGSITNYFQIRDNTAGTLFSMSNNGGCAFNGMILYDFKNNSTTSIIRNSAAALALRGGTSSTTRALQFGVNNASSTNANVAFNFTGAIHDIVAGALTRTWTGILNDLAVSAGDGNTINYTMWNNIPSFVMGTCTFSYTFFDYNPTITGTGTTTHSAFRVRAGLNAFGHGNVPTAFMDLGASTTASASLRLRTGAAPTTPNDGDIWQDGTNVKVQIAGVLKTFVLV